MHTARHAVAVMMLLVLPIGLGLWYVIHPFARAWRRVGPAWTYLILTVPVIYAGRLLWNNQDSLLGRDLGTNPIIIALTVPVLIVAIQVTRARRHHLTNRILMGFPELSSSGKGRLLTEGIYGRVRHPRYIEFLLFSFVYVGFANYSGTWILYALSVPLIHGIVLLEERELRARFGAEHEDYCRRVPRYVPRRRRV